MTGPTGKAGKTIILNLGGEWRGLSCMEAPGALFFDLLHVEVPAGKSEVRAPVDPLFLEACEPGSIEVVAAQPSLPLPGTVGAYVDAGNRIVVACYIAPGRPVTVVVTLAGVRRGVTSRFPVFTEQAARRNQAFWDQALQEGQQTQAARS